VKGKLTAMFYVRDTVLPVFDCSSAFKAILLYLSTFANPDGTHIFLGSRKIAEVTGYARNTVKAATRFWVDAGILVLVKQGTRGSGHASEYRIALEKGELFTLSAEGKGSAIDPLEHLERVNPDMEKGQRKGQRKGQPLTPTGVPEYRNKNTGEEEEAAAAPTHPAFRDLGCEEPFGDPRFQTIWRSEWEKIPSAGNGGFVDAMERTAKRCQRERIPVPSLFFENKRQVEKAEVEQRFHRTPL
jgi:hypothetical protein